MKNSTRPSIRSIGTKKASSRKSHPVCLYITGRLLGTTPIQPVGSLSSRPPPGHLSQMSNDHRGSPTPPPPSSLAPASAPAHAVPPSPGLPPSSALSPSTALSPSSPHLYPRPNHQAQPLTTAGGHASAAQLARGAEQVRPRTAEVTPCLEGMTVTVVAAVTAAASATSPAVAQASVPSGSAAAAATRGVSVGGRARRPRLRGHASGTPTVAWRRWVPERGAKLWTSSSNCEFVASHPVHLSTFPVADCHNVGLTVYRNVDSISSLPRIE